MPILVIAAPEEMPPELAENPDVVVIDPATIDPDLLEQIVTAAGGMIEDPDGEQMNGEGPLSDWAGEEEKEHGMGGYGDDEEEDPEKRDGMGGYGDDEDPDKAGGQGLDEEEERRPLPPPSATRGKGGRGPQAPKFSMSISGKGAAVSPLSKWAASLGAPRDLASYSRWWAARSPQVTPRLWITWGLRFAPQARLASLVLAPGPLRARRCALGPVARRLACFPLARRGRLGPCEASW